MSSITTTIMKSGITTILIALIALAVVIDEVKAQELLYSDIFKEDPYQYRDTKFTLDDTQNNDTSLERTTKKPLPEVPKITMDIITVIWYLSTFLALAAFFFLMACSDRRCNRSRIIDNEQPPIIPPPTPAPSYSEFAPPSYESVIKQQQHIFVVPVSVKIPSTTTTEQKKHIDIKFQTVNEVQKNG